MVGKKQLNMQNVGVGRPSDVYLNGNGYCCPHLNEIGTEVFLEMATAAGVSCSDLNSDIVEKMVEECKKFIRNRLEPVISGKFLQFLPNHNV